jgi:hypothetical protein
MPTAHQWRKRFFAVQKTVSRLSRSARFVSAGRKQGTAFCDGREPDTTFFNSNGVYFLGN